MLRSDVLVIKTLSFLVCQLHYLASSICKAFVHSFSLFRWFVQKDGLAQGLELLIADVLPADAF